MSAAAAARASKSDTPEPTRSAADLFPQMHFGEKLWLTIVCGIVLAGALLLVWPLVAPRDPYAAFTLVFRRSLPLTLITLIVFAAVGSTVATLLMRGRLMDVGLFAVGVGLTGIALKGGDLTVLLQYKADEPAARGAVFGLLAVDVLLMTLVWAAAYVAGTTTELLAGLNGPAVKLDTNENDQGTTSSAPQSTKLGLLHRWLAHAARRTGQPADWSNEIRQGLGVLVITALVATVLIRIMSGRPVAPVVQVQVCFAIGVGFWVGSLVAMQFCQPALRIWPCLAVPVVALVGSLAGWVWPGLPDSLRIYREVVIIAPNALARGLPIEYLAVGPAAAVLGIWTSQRMQRAREEAAEEE